MDVRTQRRVLAVLGLGLIVSMLLVQWREASIRAREAVPKAQQAVATPRSAACVECHDAEGRGITDPWRQSVHATVGVGCVECHAAARAEADGFDHYGERIVTIVTPRTCGSCHPVEAAEFARSAHARAAEALATPYAQALAARAEVGASTAGACEACHGSSVRLVGTGGERIDAAHLVPDADGRPTSAMVVGRVARDADGRPTLDSQGWPNAGAGRRNLDGSLGTCSSCHGRHDFSARRARRPESCAPCHHGAEQPELEIYAASRHGTLWAEVADRAELARKSWQLGRDYATAPSCSTCHLSGHTRAGAITHDPGSRLGWQHRAAGSRRRDTDREGRLVAASATAGAEPPADTWQDKRERMRQICLHCHGSSVVRASFARMDSWTESVDARFAAPSVELTRAMVADGVGSPAELDEPVDWHLHAVTHVSAMTAKLGMAMGSAEHAGAEGAVAASRQVCADLLPALVERLGRLDGGPRAEQAFDATLRAATTLAAAAGCVPSRPTTPP